MTAVELSAAVVAAARRDFGLGTCEAAGGLELVAGCAYGWLADAPPASVDVLVIDLEDGGDGKAAGSRLELLAPPAALLAEGGQLMAAAGAALVPGGVVAFNIIASGPEAAAAIPAAAQKLRRGLGSGFSLWICRAPDTEDTADNEDAAALGHQAIVFAAKVTGKTGSAEAPTREAVAAALEGLPPLVERPDEWLASWEPVVVA